MTLEPLRANALDFHRTLLSDTTGQEAFRTALRWAIRDGDTVLDLGAGTGIHAMFACQAGARKVYAIDRHPIFGLAKGICRINGFADRIVFLSGSAQQIVLPERVDVLSVHVGLWDTLALLVAVRDKFLRPGGLVVPAAARIFCAPLESSSAHQRIQFWQQPHHGLTFAPIGRYVRQVPHLWRIQASELIAPGSPWAEVDFARVTEAPISRTTQAVAMRPGIIHGIGMWYQEQFSPDVAICTGPGCKEPFQLWPSYFLPLEQPLTVRARDVISMTVHATGEQGPESWEAAVGAPMPVTPAVR